MIFVVFFSFNSTILVVFIVHSIGVKVTGNLGKRIARKRTVRERIRIHNLENNFRNSFDLHTKQFF